MERFTDLAATHALDPRAATGGDDDGQLLVVDASSSRWYVLPRQGTVLIGRGEEADVRLDDNAASRRHARIIVAPGDIRISDLDSRNGTRVNGQPIVGGAGLGPGDVIAIGEATIILRSRRTPVPARLPVDGPALRRRLEEELCRAEVSREAFAVVTLLLESAVDPLEITRVVDGHLRLMDMAAASGPTELTLVLPGLETPAAEQVAERITAAIGAVGIQARAGVASHPADGADADALLGLARSLANRAAPGGFADSEAAARLAIGDRSIIVADPAMQGLFGLVRRLARSDLPVLIRGETGSGKENAAYALHGWSPRASGPFVAINCAALPETLVESELFGAEKGAYSGSAGAKPGLLETAAGGTVFFDELGELPRAIQPKLLRAIETRTTMRLGSTRERPLDVRFVAATNRDLEEEIRAGRFREDLLFRLNAATVVLPPLRERPSEIAILAKLFLEEACRRLDQPGKSLSTGAVHELMSYRWPGNVRELKNVMDFLAVAVEEPVLEPWHLRARLSQSERARATPTIPGHEPETNGEAPGRGAVARPDASPPRTFATLADEIREIEQRRMIEALEATGWIQTRAAERIGMPLRTFQQKVKVYGLVQRKGGDPA